MKKNYERKIKNILITSEHQNIKYWNVKIFWFALSNYNCFNPKIKITANNEIKYILKIDSISWTECGGQKWKIHETRFKIETECKREGNYCNNWEMWVWSKDGDFVYYCKDFAVILDWTYTLFTCIDIL